MARRQRRANRDAELEVLHNTIQNASQRPEEEDQDGPQGEIGNLMQMLAALQQPKRQIKAPIYNGLGNIETYIRQFTDVANANDWSPADRLLHLRLSLTDKAQECGEFDNLEDIWEELRSRFGLNQKQARDRLSTLRRAPGMSIHELGMEISRLTRLGYPNMAVPDQEDLALDRFQAIMNNVELRRYLTPLRPQTMRECLRLSEEFFQVDQGSRPTKVTAVTETPDVVMETLKDLQNVITQQAAEIQTLRQQKQTPAPVTPPLTAAPGQPSLQDLLMASLASSLANPGTKPSQDRQKRPGPPACYHCGGPHLKRNCPELRQPINQPAAVNQRQPAENYSGPTQ